jgi:hypothetical protein
VYSADKKFRLRVIPRELRGQLAYFEGVVEKRKAPGQAVGGQSRCFGILEKRTKGSAFEMVWSRPLLNDVAPVVAIVSDDGKFVATFDNWHSTGYGPHALVIYGPAGDPVKKLGLLEFLQEPEIEKLRRSVSSVSWYGDAVFEHDKDASVLRVGVDPVGRINLDAVTGALLRPKPELAAIEAQVDRCRALRLTDKQSDAKRCQAARRSETWCALCESLGGTR